MCLTYSTLYVPSLVFKIPRRRWGDQDWWWVGARAKIRGRKAAEKRNVASGCGWKVKCVSRNIAEIPLKPRSARIRKGSLSASYLLSLSLSLSVILSCTFSRGVTLRSRSSAFKLEAAFTPDSSHQRSPSSRIKLSAIRLTNLTSTRDFPSNKRRGPRRYK